MSYIAVTLVLIDNFQLSSINIDLSTQNETLEKNNLKLQEAHASLQKLEQELEKLLKPAAELKAAKDENAEIVIALNETIPEDIQNLPARLQNVNTLLNQLLSTADMKEMMTFETDLRSKVSAMLQVFNQFNDELRPITEKVDTLSETLATTVSKFENNVTITGQQIVALQSVLKAVQNYPQRSVI
jgi:DNA repair exonuclease SbcCD ATPase subunit